VFLSFESFLFALLFFRYLLHLALLDVIFIVTHIHVALEIFVLHRAGWEITFQVGFFVHLLIRRLLYSFSETQPASSFAQDRFLFLYDLGLLLRLVLLQVVLERGQRGISELLFFPFFENFAWGLLKLVAAILFSALLLVEIQHVLADVRIFARRFHSHGKYYIINYRMQVCQLAWQSITKDT